jgi:hypothetical protein
MMTLATPVPSFAQIEDNITIVANIECIKWHLEHALGNYQTNDILLAKAHSGRPKAEQYSIIEWNHLVKQES